MPYLKRKRSNNSNAQKQPQRDANIEVKTYDFFGQFSVEGSWESLVACSEGYQSGVFRFRPLAHNIGSVAVFGPCHGCGVEIRQATAISIEMSWQDLLSILELHLLPNIVRSCLNCEAVEKGFLAELQAEIDGVDERRAQLVAVFAKEGIKVEIQKSSLGSAVLGGEHICYLGDKRDFVWIPDWIGQDGSPESIARLNSLATQLNVTIFPKEGFLVLHHPFSWQQHLYEANVARMAELQAHAEKMRTYVGNAELAGTGAGKGAQM